MTDSVKQAQKHYCSRAMMLAIFVSLGLILAGLKTIGKGLVLGTIFSIINFIIMAETIPLKFGGTRRKAFAYSLFSILIRYAIIAVPVVIAIKYDEINLFSTIAGIFSVQLVILAEHLSDYFFSLRRKQI